MDRLVAYHLLLLNELGFFSLLCKQSKYKNWLSVEADKALRLS